MNNQRKTIRNAIICLLSAVMLLTGIPGKTAFASGVSETEGKSDTAAAAEKQELTPEELYRIDGGDAEYWKYYDAEGNRIIKHEEQTLLSGSDETNSDEVTITSPYNGKEYSVMAGYRITHAIDVSKYNNGEEIDWDKVKEDGIESVIVRCAYRGYGDAGNLAADSRFEENIEGALAAGLKVGIYIYSQAINTDEAVEEANKCLDLCSDYLDELDLPVVMDVEYANPDGEGEGGRLFNAGLTRAEQTTVSEAFCKTIEEAGYQAMVYANKSMLSNNMNPSDLTDAGYKIWLARYNSYAGYEDSPYLMWQYSSSGSVDGISGNVDLDFLYTSTQTDEAPVWNTIEQNNDCVKLSWKMVPGAEGYEIQRSTDKKNWSDLTSLAAAACICYTDSTTEAENQYYYRIRTYYTEEGKTVYGLWSDVTSISVESSVIFEDVDKEAYYYDAVQWAYKNGITSGIDETHFAPGKFCTRGQAVTFLWRTEGRPKASSDNCPFIDIDPEDYYYDAVLWAYEKGIAAGMDDKHFKPNETVTRGQFVTFIHRTKGKPESSLAASPFKDVPDNEYYTEAVLWAVENEITAGVDADHFAPENNCNRGDVVTFLYRAYK